MRFWLSLPGVRESDQLLELELRGISNMMGISPWHPSPWGESWCDEGEDPSSLKVKKKAMERYASSVIDPAGKAR